VGRGECADRGRGRRGVGGGREVRPALRTHLAEHRGGCWLCVMAVVMGVAVVVRIGRSVVVVARQLEQRVPVWHRGATGARDRKIEEPSEEGNGQQQAPTATQQVKFHGTSQRYGCVARRPMASSLP